jgi:choloylglycine hydrolase
MPAHLQAFAWQNRLHRHNPYTGPETLAMKMFARSLAFAAIVAQSLLQPAIATACTGITIKPKDGSVIYARTLEFAVDTESEIIVVPRDMPYVGTAADGKSGLHWQTKYGFVGANAFGLPVCLDGLNEKGLAVGLFYFPGYADYQTVRSDDAGKVLAPWELGTFLLGTCANVPEAVAATKGVRVGATVQKDMGMVPPVHYIVTDATGKSVVIEYVKGELNIHDNPLGVMTNAPTSIGT